MFFKPKGEVRAQAAWSTVGHSFAESMMEQILQGAVRILESTGILLPEAPVRDRLARLGVAFRGDRALLEPKAVRRYLEYTQTLPNRHGQRKGGAPGKPMLDCTINEYCTNLLDLHGNLAPYSMDSLTETARFVEKYAVKLGFTPNVPGYPSDVPKDLEALARLKICAQNCHGGLPLEPTSIYAAGYMMEMCDVLGTRMERLPVYVASPLTLGGESLAMALHFHDRISAVKVSSMPSFGVTTPLNIPAAFSVALAECLGSAWIVHALTGLNAEFLVQMHPFDFRAMSFVYGSPEHLLLGHLASEFNAKLFGHDFQVTRGNIHTLAKTPGAQAAAEKASLITVGALMGARVFNGAGALSLDEIFSPIQLVIDLEILSQVWRYLCGVSVGEMPENLVALVEEGLRGGFMGTDMTLDHMEDFLWYPEVFTRKTLEAWSRSGKKDAVDAARDIVASTMAEPTAYRLPEHQSKALDAIWSRALAGSV